MKVTAVNLSRRQILQGVAAIGAGAMLAPLLPMPAFAESFSPMELQKQGLLEDMFIGSPDAPVTIIEYASLTCSHCATFATESFPYLKKEYIDTGKVYYTMREFPLDNLAFAASMLSRCAPKEQYYDILHLFFEQQRKWAFTQDPLGNLKAMAKQIGYNDKTFEECLSNQSILDGVNESRERANKEFGVNSTPTFFINGEKHPGALTVEQLDEIIKPLL
ncbi:thioredoxin domain-containing protein [Breoghania sp.]|uniref:thioredoxin domain-containing protein n=1 Tax=Breoghania sp. TaxID=2065378 RepID=UPI00374A2A71